MRKVSVVILSIVVGVFIIFDGVYMAIANSLKEESIRSNIKNNLLTGFIYDDNGNKTAIFNTILKLTGLDEETVIKLMENETADNIITDVVNSIYDYNLTGDASYKYTPDRIISIVEDNIDKVLAEINYSITTEDRNEVIEYTKNNTDYIIDTIYSTDIGDYKHD